jgi:class 3 adenylate cyclase
MQSSESQSLPLNVSGVRKFSNWRSIRSKIVAIALGLIVLMIVTSILSMLMSKKVGVLLDELTYRYIPAYSHLARANVHSLERALALRRMVIAKTQVPPDEEGYKARLKTFNERNVEIQRETEAARKLINAIIDDVSTPSDNAALGRIDARIESAVAELRGRFADEESKLLGALDAGDFVEARQSLGRLDDLRDEFIEKIDAIRSEMLSQVYASTSTVIRNQRETLAVSAIVTGLAATLGLGFAFLVSGGITRPVRQLLEGTREIEAGRLDKSLTVSTRDEIGELSAAFNRMVEQLRRNQRIRETFGRYIDPKIAEGLIDRPDVAATDGQRRVMTVMFCDLQGFSSMSEGMTPQGLVKIVNCYFSTMSAPIRENRGIIDKYIGDAIMAYWGPPFIEELREEVFACNAAIEMVRRLPDLQRRIPELLGLRKISTQFDIRIGVATGEVLAGSIGSELMMNFTVMGDAVNLASRLEAANKAYRSRILLSETTANAVGDAFELREIDRIIVLGQSVPQTVYELIGKKDDLSTAQAEMRTRYADALAAYRSRRWADARIALTEALDAVPSDGPCQALLERITYCELHNPPAEWDGSWRIDQK